MSTDRGERLIGEEEYLECNDAGYVTIEEILATAEKLAGVILSAGAKNLHWEVGLPRTVGGQDVISGHIAVYVWGLF